ncbi:MAG: cytochrome P450 [Acidimicrobiales bacterium]
MALTFEPRSDLGVDEIDLSDPLFWALPEEQREGAFAILRQERPISFHEERDYGLFPQGPGYWALTRHRDVLDASRQPDLFCSGKGSNIGDMPEPFLDFFGSMINMDDPRHARLRRIVSRGFTPRHLADLQDSVELRAKEIVDRLIDKGSCDFVTDVAAALPLAIICDMMGIPESQYDFVFDRTNIILGAGDPEYVSDVNEVVGALLTAGAELAQLVQELGAERRANPTDDLTSALVNTDVDGEMLTDEELGPFFVLLVVAGNETTRNAIAHGMHLLTENPDQKRAWIDDVNGLATSAVEEIVRWATPVIHFRRTVTRDGATLGGQEFEEGDKVVLFYNSANRDEAVFKDPFAFDLARDPNPHVGFGGPGPHFCLGAHLARREITVMFRELLTRVPDIAAVSEPDRLLSNFIHGIKHLDVVVNPG